MPSSGRLASARFCTLMVEDAILDSPIRNSCGRGGSFGGTLDPAALAFK
jgi:hypothetical protein